MSAERFKNYRTHKSVVQPRAIADAGGNAYVTHTSLTSDTGLAKRGVRYRQFYQAVVHSDASTTQSFVIKLQLVSGSTTYELDRVSILPGETYVWNDWDFGMDLMPTEYMKITWVVSSAHSNDKLNLFIRTRDVV